MPEYLGKNIGTEFIAWGIKELRIKGYTKVALCAAEENIRAQKFYEKYGFIHDGEISTTDVGKELKEYRCVKNL